MSTKYSLNCYYSDDQCTTASSSKFSSTKNETQNVNCYNCYCVVCVSGGLDIVFGVPFEFLAPLMGVLVLTYALICILGNMTVQVSTYNKTIAHINPSLVIISY